MDFRRRLVGTLRAIAPVLDEPGVLVVGSEVPNLIEPGAAATLVVSEDVDVGVPVHVHGRVKARLAEVVGLAPSEEEPSVWVPSGGELLEVNFVGIDERAADPRETYVLEDATLPLMVFGPLSLVRPGRPIDVDGVRVPLPRPAGLFVEKLLTDRTGVKGDRDLLVALGILLVSTEDDLAEAVALYRRIGAELRHAARSNLALLSLLPASEGMPDPRPHRARIAALLRALEREDEAAG
jgi:hypothetical protein